MTKVAAVINFAAQEPHASFEIEQMLEVCSPEEIAYLETFARALLASVMASLAERKLLSAVRRLPEGCNVVSVETLVEKVIATGGCIIAASECSDLEIAAACMESRYAVTPENVGFVMRPQRWLDSMKPKREGSNVVFLETYRRNAVL